MFAELNPAYVIAFVFFLTSGSYLYLSIALYTGNAGSKMLMDYFIVGTCLFLYSFFYALMTILENEALLRVFWAGGFFFGCIFYPRWILFLSNMVTFRFKMTAPLTKVALVATAILAAACIYSGDAVFIPTRLGNQFSYQNSIIFLALFALILLLLIGIIFLHIRWWREAEMKRHRIQALIFIIIASIFAPVGILTDYVIPAFTGITIIPLGCVTLLIASIPVWISLRTSNTLSITVPNVSGYIFKSVTIPVLVLDHKNMIALENSAALDFFGLSVVGKSFHEIIINDEDAPEQSFLTDGLGSRQLKVETQSGSKICDLLLTVERDKYGDALCKVAMLRDITELEYNDNLLRAVNHATALLIQAEKDNFETALWDSMGLMAGAVDADRMYIWKNHTVDGRLHCTQLYEWSESAEPQQGNEYTVDIPYDDNIPGWEEKFTNGLCVNGVVRDLSPEEQAQLGPQGIISILVVPIYLHEELWGFVGFDDCRNERLFTENEISILRSGSLLIANALLRHDMNLKLESTLEKAQLASRTKSDFLANMSHEIRTPMNAIIGMTNIAKAAQSIERKDYALGKIEGASKHLLGIINDILDMSKIEADKLELNPETFNFEDLLKKVISIINFHIVEKHQKLVVYIDENIPRTLSCDNQRLAQILTNLLSNAVKFTHESGTISLNTTLLEDDGNSCMIQFVVADTGVGISEEQQTRLFNPFEQAESSTTRKYGGTGLGLAITKRIVELMGGNISLQSVFGEGSVFTFTIRAEKLRVDTEDSILALKNIDANKIRILVVDDDEDICEYFVDLSMRFNINCETARSGEEAVELIKSGNTYDLIFVDWVMPGMSGIELSRRIKDIGIGESIIIMISSFEWQKVEAEARDAGIDRFLPKPIFPSEFIECINTCFNLDLLNENQTEKSERIDRFWGYRVLLVEDVEINREIVIALLEPTLIDIDCAENGVEAVKMFSESPEKYNIVFMDLQMPEMDGYEATRAIRAMECATSKTVPIIAMTANVFKEDVENCLIAGMNDHLGKPLDLDDVLRILRQHLFKQRPARERRKDDRRKTTSDRRQQPDRRKGDRRQSE